MGWTRWWYFTSATNYSKQNDKNLFEWVHCKKVVPPKLKGFECFTSMKRTRFTYNIIIMTPQTREIQTWLHGYGWRTVLVDNENEIQVLQVTAFNKRPQAGHLMQFCFSLTTSRCIIFSGYFPAHIPHAPCLPPPSDAIFFCSNTSCALAF